MPSKTPPSSNNNQRGLFAQDKRTGAECLNILATPAALTMQFTGIIEAVRVLKGEGTRYHCATARGEAYMVDTTQDPEAAGHLVAPDFSGTSKKNNPSIDI